MKKLIAVILILASFSAYSLIVNQHGVNAAPNSSATLPTCAVGVRGLVYNTEGASGVADALKVCLKDASNNYSWVTK